MSNNVPNPNTAGTWAQARLRNDGATSVGEVLKRGENAVARNAGLRRGREAATPTKAVLAEQPVVIKSHAVVIGIRPAMLAQITWDAW